MCNDKTFECSTDVKGQLIKKNAGVSGFKSSGLQEIAVIGREFKLLYLTQKSKLEEFHPRLSASDAW